MEVLTFNVDKDRRNLTNDVQNFDIDFKNSPSWVQARQYENQMRQVQVNVQHGDGTPFDLTGANPVLEGFMPDGVHRIIDAKHGVMIDPVNGQFRFDFPAPVFAVSGSYKQIFFRLYRAGKNIATLEFSMEVLADKVISGLVPSDYLTPFEDLYDKLKDYITKANGDFETAMAQWKKDVANLITDLNADVSGINLTITEIKTQLASLEDKIKADGLLTQADLDNALKPISDLMNELNALDEVTIEVDGGTVEPFKTSLSSFKNTINNNSGVARIALLQDIHYQRAAFSEEYGEATTRGLIHIQHFGTLKDVLDLAVYNGDNVHGREAKSNTINRIKQLINTHRLAFDDLPTMWTIGNHDDNNIYFIGKARNENILTLSELENAFEINKTYGYRDFEDKKLRVIVLNSFENPEIIGKDGLPKYTRDYSSVFSANQLTWLSKTLEVPTGYSVIAFTHVPPEGYCNNKPYNDYRNVNHDLMLGLFNAFVEGTSYTASGTNTDYPAQVNVDYSNQGKGNLIGIVTGHEHRDVEPQVINGVRVIERTCNLPAGTGRSIGDISEEAFDVIEIDSVNKHCKFNRFGAGNSLEFDY